MRFCDQDDVIKKYGLSSVSLEKFFRGPAPEFQSPTVTVCPPPAVSSRSLPAINGHLFTSTDRRSYTGKPAAVADDAGIIDLTDDDFDVPTVAVVADRFSPGAADARLKNHQKRPGRSIFWPLFARRVCWDIQTCLRRGSVVRTSVCSWQTFSDLRLIHF